MDSLEALTFTAAMNEIAKGLKDIAEALNKIDNRLVVIDKHICMVGNVNKGGINE